MIVLASLGRSAQWNRDLVADNAAEIAIGGDRFAPLYRELDPAEAAAVLTQYERRHSYIATGIRRAVSRLSAGTTTGPMPSANSS